LVALDEPGLAQHAHVMADGALAEIERPGQMADARLAVGLCLDEAEDTKTCRISERLQGSCELLGVVRGERLSKERRTARCDHGNCLHGNILTGINDLCKMDIDDRRYFRRRLVPEILDPVTQRHVDQAAARLADEFKGIFSEETIARYIGESLDMLGSSRINAFVPVLAHRFARERLRALAQVEGKLTKEQPEVLFVCIHNAGRSQMAAGLVKLRSDGRIHVRSAGSDPSDEINPAVIEAMTEIGVDMSQEFPKPLTDEVVRAADVVITMGCGDACPIYPGKRYEDWTLDDPAGKDLAAVRLIRDEIDARAQQLVAALVQA
jgi:protein-tyrosine-phosphatase